MASNGLEDLAIFVAVAETEGFSAAAKRLGASKAMVSVAITRLEARLGVRLFQRTTRRLSLTEAGTATLPHAQRALVAARDAEEAATQALASPRGVLRVSAPMSFGLLHVVPALSAFAKAHAEVQVDLVLDDRMVDLVEGGFDLAIRIATLQDSNLIAHRIGTTRSALVAHPDYLARAGTPRSPGELAEHAVLLYSLSSSGARLSLTRGKDSETIQVKGPLKANSSLALHRAVLDGLGIARIPLFAVAEDLARGVLVQVLPDWSSPEHGIFAVTTAREYLPRKTRAFIDFLRERIGAPAYWERATASTPRKQRRSARVTSRSSPRS